jgi:hypothetical protein
MTKYQIDAGRRRAGLLLPATAAEAAHIRTQLRFLELGLNLLSVPVPVAFDAPPNGKALALEKQFLNAKISHQGANIAPPMPPARVPFWAPLALGMIVILSAGRWIR